MNYNYYYNQVPGNTPWRNNLIYTSLISEDKKVFVQHYVNDSDYHKGKNQVVDPELMYIKWQRELHFLQDMALHNPDMVPEILDIDFLNFKIYLKIDGVDFWQQSLDKSCSFDLILSDWQDQMLRIIKAHKDNRWYKFSMHPSSYFIVNGRLKSINYFFTYLENEGPITIAEHQSHLSDNRKLEMQRYTTSLNIDWYEPQTFNVLENLCWESFRTNYPKEFIEKVKCII